MPVSYRDSVILRLPRDRLHTDNGIFWIIVPLHFSYAIVYRLSFMSKWVTSMLQEVWVCL